MGELLVFSLYTRLVFAIDNTIHSDNTTTYDTYALLLITEIISLHYVPSHNDTLAERIHITKIISIISKQSLPFKVHETIVIIIIVIILIESIIICIILSGPISFFCENRTYQ